MGLSSLSLCIANCSDLGQSMAVLVQEREYENQFIDL